MKPMQIGDAPPELQPSSIRESLDAQLPQAQNYNTAQSRAQVGMSMPSPIPSKGNTNRLRGRIHQGASDVLNGIGGMEHLSNSLN